MVYLTKPVFALCLVAISVATVAASQLLAARPATTLQLGDYASYECVASGAPALPVMRVLSLSSFKALDLANNLCASAQVQSTYRAVNISWRKRGTLTAQDIVDQHYDLFLNRRYMMHGLVPEFERFYTSLYDTPTYDVYWVAKHSQPELSAAYFADKTVGLSEDFYSQSFYLLPSKAMLEAGIHLREEQKRFYPDVAALYNALQTGEVDIITNPDIGHWMDALEPSYRLKIREPAPPATWFAKRNSSLLTMRCLLISTLKNVDVASAKILDEGCA